ncbi:MAG: heme lyase CcmF/NrfE family subunit [Chloroflexi bacterium]|nr:heme lyase CcmF/NrfE family subunit [Chloroflexota bacterium]
MPILGYISIFVALVVAVYTGIAAWLGAKRNLPQLVTSARNGTLLFTALMTIAVAVIVVALYTRDFSIALVANNTSSELQSLYTVTALWANQAGSLLFWSWILSLYSAAVILRKWERDHDLMPYVIVALMAIQTFFAFMLAFVSSPFARWWMVGGKTVMSLFRPEGGMLFIPPDGQGLNPLLQHPAMAIHPPMLYLGYVGFTIPFVFGMAALLSGNLGVSWLRTTRRWTLAPWLFLSMGLMLGGRWAYDVLGWGGYWGWDPVENSAFMPWLTGTAFLHSVMVQERRGMLKVWNMGLIIITFALVLFGTFLTRSGIISSVHAFAESDIGAWFLSFIAGITLVATGLLFTRVKELRSEREIDSLFSREAFFLLNNLLFVGAAFVVLWGTVYPLFSELVYNQKLTVGPPYFNQVAAPIFGTLLLVMAIIPLIGWSGATGAKFLRKLVRPLIGAVIVGAILFALGVHEWVALLGYFLAALALIATIGEIAEGAWARARNTHENVGVAFLNLLARNRQRYGGYLIHIAVAMMAVGIIGSQVYTTDVTRALKPGETLQVRDYTLQYEKLSPEFPSGEARVTSATLGVFRGGVRVATISPARSFFERQGETQTQPAIVASLQEDLYVIIAGWEPNFETVTFRAYVNPMIAWLWLGGIGLVLFTLIAAWPNEREPALQRQDTLAKQPAHA